MIYEKYVLNLGWHIKLFPACTAAFPLPDAAGASTCEAALVMLHSLTAWLQVSFSLSSSHAALCSTQFGVTLLKSCEL